LVTQQARRLTWTFGERAEPLRSLIRDRDSEFTRRFDAVFLSEGIEIIRTPFAPNVSTGSCFSADGISSLVLRDFVDHYNGHGRIGRSADTASTEAREAPVSERAPTTEHPMP
jgi:hypothetical protein